MYCYDYAYMRQHSIKGKCNSKFGHLDQYSLFHVVFLPKLRGSTKQQGITSRCLADIT